MHGFIKKIPQLCLLLIPLAGAIIIYYLVSSIKLENRLTLTFTCLAALATFVTDFMLIYAINTLDETKKANQGNLILQLNRDFFFNERLYKLRKAIDNNEPLLRSKNKKFSEQDIDDYIGFFEMVSGLLERKILDKKLIDYNFSVFIIDAWRNKEIGDYIKSLRKAYSYSEIYTGFEKLAKQYCKEQDLTKD